MNMTDTNTGPSGTLVTAAIPRVRTATTALETWLAPLSDLFIRAMIFRVFFYSGLVKINDWDNTRLLFQYEYAVPILPVTLAAVLATLFELVASSLVLVGLFARLAALPLLGMALVIQFVLGAANPAYNQLGHFLWMALLLAVIARGPGRLSLDQLIRRRWLDGTR